jgi:uncharacterized protein YbbK (DUF523 family)/uncharacterized protein YbgA (DUF1722 family)
VSQGPLRLGVSACLLGRAVRHDAGHKREPLLTGLLGGVVEWVPVCPEVELGLGVPRPPIRLERARGGIRLVEPQSAADYTGPMRSFAAERVAHLESLDLSGYVLKSGSPSCGMARVRVWSREPGRRPERSGRGVFAAVLMQRLPLLPVEEEGRLHHARLRENFVERILAYRRLRALFAQRWRHADLVRFHGAHELQLLAHEPRSVPALDRLVVRAGSYPPGELAARYGEAFMSALARIATRQRHVKALERALGQLRGQLARADRTELAARIEEYGRGLVPLIVPIRSIRRHARSLEVAQLADQTYLDLPGDYAIP